LRIPDGSNATDVGREGTFSGTKTDTCAGVGYKLTFYVGAETVTSGNPPPVDSAAFDVHPDLHITTAAEGHSSDSMRVGHVWGSGSAGAQPVVKILSGLDTGSGTRQYLTSTRSISMYVTKDESSDAGADLVKDVSGGSDVSCAATSCSGCTGGCAVDDCSLCSVTATDGVFTFEDLKWVAGAGINHKLRFATVPADDEDNEVGDADHVVSDAFKVWPGVIKIDVQPGDADTGDVFGQLPKIRFTMTDDANIGRCTDDSVCTVTAKISDSAQQPWYGLCADQRVGHHVAHP